MPLDPDVRQPYGRTKKRWMDCIKMEMKHVGVAPGLSQMEMVLPRSGTCHNVGIALGRRRFKCSLSNCTAFVITDASGSASPSSARCRDGAANHKNNEYLSSEKNETSERDHKLRKTFKINIWPLLNIPRKVKFSSELQSFVL